MSSTINSDAMSAQFAAAIREGLMAAAEPLLEKAIADMRIAMRKRLAEMAAGVVESSYSLERAGNIVTIRVNLGLPPGKAGES